MDTYERYVNLRNAKSLKDVDISKQTGIVRSVFSSWKSGRSAPNADKLLKISKALNVSLEYLLTGENPHYKDQRIIERPILDRLISAASQCTDNDIERAINFFNRIRAYRDAINNLPLEDIEKESELQED